MNDSSPKSYTKLNLRQKLGWSRSRSPNPSSVTSPATATTANITESRHSAATLGTAVQPGDGSGTVSPEVTQQQSLSAQPLSPTEQILAATLNRLSAQDRLTLQQNTISNSNDLYESIDRAIKAVGDKCKLCQDKRWTYTIAGRRISLRETADKVVDWLNRFKAIGDIASNADPLHVGLPWAGIRLILEALVTDSNAMTSLLVGCETVLYTASRLRVYVDFMLCLSADPSRSNLERSIVLMYAHSLQFIAQAIRLYQKSTIERVFSALWSVSEIGAFEKQSDSLADDIERDASNCARVTGMEDRQVIARLQQHMQQTLQELQHVRQLQSSLDRLHLNIDLGKIPYVKGALYNSIAGVHTLCHPKTRLDLLAQIQQWTQQPDGKSIFWLHGAAGAGKSTISWTIAKWLYDGAPHVDLGATFFFKRGEGDRGSATQFFPTIVRQLLLKVDGMDSLVAKVIEEDPFIFDKVLTEQFHRLLLQPLQNVPASASGKPLLIVVVDALDECESDRDIETILNLWSQLSHITTIRIRLFLTCRPDPAVRFAFGRLPQNLVDNVFLHDIVPSSTVTEDLRIYFRDAFVNIRQSVDAHMAQELDLDVNWPGEDTIQALVDLSKPLFIFAATVCRFVGDLEFDPSERLREVLAHRAHNQYMQMEALYLPVLKHLTAPTRSATENMKLCAEFRFIVGSLICLTEPLSIKELAILLNTSIATIERRLRPLHSVLYISDDRSVPIQTLHLSFVEFLSSEDLANEPFRVDSAATHLALMRQCLRLLSGPDGLRRNICDLDSPGTLRQDVDSSIIQDKLPSTLQYACRYWVHHVDLSRMKITDDDEIHDFLRKHYLHWLEAMSFMNRISDVVRLLGTLRSCQSTIRSERGSNFLQDAHRFLLTNRYIADLSPLQLYSSAIVFSPHGSLVRRACGEPAEWIQQSPNVAMAWGLELQKLQGHRDLVDTMTFSRDGLTLATASQDSTIRLWNVSTGQEIQRLEGYSGEVKSLIFSQNDSLVALVVEGRALRLWELWTGRQMWKIGTSYEWYDAAYSERLSLVALASKDGTVRLLDPYTGEEARKVESQNGIVYNVIFSPDDSFLMVGNSEKFCLWRTSDWQEIDGFRFTKTSRCNPAVSHDGKLLAAFPDFQTLVVWDISTAGQLHKIRLRDYRHYTKVIFSPDGMLLAACDLDGAVDLWNLYTGKSICKLEGNPGGLMSLAFSCNSQYLATTSTDKVVRLWDMSIAHASEISDGHTEKVEGLVLSHDGSLVASIRRHGTLHLWNISIGQEIQKLNSRAYIHFPIEFSKDDSLLACARDHGKIVIWHKVTFDTVQELEGHCEPISALSFSNSGSILVSASLDHTIRLWSVSTGQEIGKLETTNDWASQVVFSHDDSLLVLALEKKGTVQIWDLSKGAPVQEIKVGDSTTATSAISLSLDGSLVAVASYSYPQAASTIRVWALSTGEVVRTLTGLGYVDALKFTSNDTRLMANRGMLSINSEDTSSTGLESNGHPTIFVEPEWVTCGGERILWLPQEYRHVVAVHEDMIAFGLASGRVGIMRIDRDMFKHNLHSADVRLDIQGQDTV